MTTSKPAQALGAESAGDFDGGEPGKSQLFVNNAKVLATYMIPIADDDNYQVLHLIDSPLEFAYLMKKNQVKPIGANNNKKFTKKSLNLDDFEANSYEQQQAMFDFYERFGDYQTSMANIDLLHSRVFKSPNFQREQQQKISLDKDDFNFERLANYFRSRQELRGKFFGVNETTGATQALNTYFLPINSDELDTLLSNGALQAKVFEAFLIPNEVLFTRAMALGQSHQSAFNNLQQKVSLSLAKTMPPSSELDDAESTTRKYLATPLLLQATCEPINSEGAGQFYLPQQEPQLRNGILSAELILANIPLSNGVLHLIKKPTLLYIQDNLIQTSDNGNSILDYLNDSDNILSNVVNSVGSKTSSGLRNQSVKLNKFRELLARERSILSQLTHDQFMNKTVLAPSDEAISKLRYDLRALITNDESLIPKSWDVAYRRDVLERIAKRHIILHQTVTTSDLLGSTSSKQFFSNNGKPLDFKRSAGDSAFEVESDSTRAQLIHHDLIGTSNGVLHVIDRVLGEEQETIDSLLNSIVLKFNSSLNDHSLGSEADQLSSIIQANIRQMQLSQQQQQQQDTLTNSIQLQQQPQEQAPANPELTAISRAIGQYLSELELNNRRQLQLLASSVNVSYQLAKLTSPAEGPDDWNDKFKSETGAFTYFVPSDLAWLKLQQQQPELYKPLLHFLESNADESAISAPPPSALPGDNSILEPRRSPKSSESSHRLRKVSTAGSSDVHD